MAAWRRTHTAELLALGRNNLNQDGGTLLTPELQAQLWRIVAAHKPMRSHIDFKVGVQIDQPLSIASATTSCNVQRMDFVGGPDNSLHTSSHTVQSAANPILNTRTPLAGSPDTTMHTSTHTVQSAAHNVVNSRARLNAAPNNTLSASSHAVAASINTLCMQINRMVCQ